MSFQVIRKLIRVSSYVCVSVCCTHFKLLYSRIYSILLGNNAAVDPGPQVNIFLLSLTFVILLLLTWVFLLTSITQAWLDISATLDPSTISWAQPYPLMFSLKFQLNNTETCLAWLDFLWLELCLHHLITAYLLASYLTSLISPLVFFRVIVKSNWQVSYTQQVFNKRQGKKSFFPFWFLSFQSCHYPLNTV